MKNYCKAVGPIYPLLAQLDTVIYLSTDAYYVALNFPR